MASQQSLPLLEGPTVPTYAPMNPDGSLKLDYVKEYGHILEKNGVKNLFINGTTGEFFSLSVDERKQVLEAWKREHGQRFQLVVHVGAGGLSETLELARHATQLGGIKALGVVAPFFVPPSSIESLVQYLQRVAEVCDGLPLLYYHIPSCSHCPLPLKEFLTVALKEVPGLCAMKFTDGDLTLLADCQKQFGHQLQILCGNEPIYAEATKLGIKEGIFATYNFYGEPLLRIREQGADASSGHTDIESLFEIINRHKKNGVIPLLKDLGRLVGLEAVGAPRLPQQALNSAEMDALAQDLRKACPGMRLSLRK